MQQKLRRRPALQQGAARAPCRCSAPRHGWWCLRPVEQVSAPPDDATGAQSQSPRPSEFHTPGTQEPQERPGHTTEGRIPSETDQRAAVTKSIGKGGFCRSSSHSSRPTKSCNARDDANGGA